MSLAAPDKAIPEVQGGNRALRTSEIRYRRLFEAAQDGIAILDADSGQIVDANPYLLNLLGYSLPEVLGKAIWEIGPPKDVDKSKKAFATLKADRYVRYADLPLESKDGRRVAVEFVSNLYPEDSGMVIQCNIRSIAARDQAEAKQRQAAAVSLAVADAESHRRLNRLIHDTVIQNLSLVNIRLGAVAKATGAAELRMAQAELATARELLQESIAQCRLLMSDLTPPLLYELGLATAMSELIQKFRKQHGALLSLECQGDTLPLSYAVRGLLFDAARELIVNALKHAGPCSIHCAIKQEQGQVQVCVQDDGAGFDPGGPCPDDARKGFGLFNTRERVEGMGGRFELCSAPGCGTTATITVPCPNGHADEDSSAYA